jgi:RHS repeat-associated protein
MKQFLRYLLLLSVLAWGGRALPSWAQQACSPSLSAGLQVWLPLDESTGTGAIDAAGQGYKGELSAAAASWQPSGGVNRGALLLGVGGYVQAPLYWQPTAFTVSWWVNPSQFANYSQAVSALSPNYSGGWGGFAFYSDASGTSYVGTDANSRIVLAPGTLVLNTWQQFTFTYTPTNSLIGVGRLYRNGQFVASQANMAAPQAWNGLCAGTAASTSLGFLGLLDDLRVYKRALADQEVQQLNQCRALPPVLSLCPPLRVTASGDATISAGGSAPLQATPSVAGTMLTFDGVDDNLQIATRDGDPRLMAKTYATTVNNFTMEAWVLPTAPHKIDPEMTQYGGLSGGQRWAFPGLHGGLYYGNADHATVALSVGTNGVSIYESGADYLPAVLVWRSPTPLTSWTHVAVVYTNRQPSLYINGVLVKQTTVSVPGVTRSLVHPTSNLGGGTYQGSIDEVRIWNVARLAADIVQTKNNVLTSLPSSLLGYWRLDEGPGLVARDLTSSYNDGHLKGGSGRPGPNSTGPSWAPSTAPLTGIDTGAPLTLSWSPTTGLSAATGATVTAAPVATTAYVVQATTTCGATAQARVTVTVTPGTQAPVLNLPVACAPTIGGTAPTSRGNAVDVVNYVRTYTARQPFTDPVALAAAGPAGVQVKTEYLDGLGRSVQTVLRQESPLGRDLVQPSTYDALGRQPRAYLPYVSGGTNAGDYHPDALKEQDDFYRTTTLMGPGLASDNTVRTGVAYSEQQYEASPLNRVTAQMAPGENWLTHPATFAERPNSAQDSVFWFQPDYDVLSMNPGYRGLYPAGMLWGTDAVDAQGARTVEWKDKSGQLVCKQVELAGTGANAPSQWLRTCYVYDDFGRLRFVLQPAASARVLAAVRQQAPAIARGLRLYLPCDQTSGTQVLDASGRNVAGQLVDGGQWVPSAGGPRAQALRLSGTAHLVVPLVWQPTAFTIAFWVKPSQVLDYSCLLSAHADNAGQDPWGNFAFHTTSDGHISAGFNYWDAAGRLGSPTGMVQAGRWQHFVFTYQGGTGTLYYNGQLVSQLAGMPAAPSWPGLLLGMGASNANLPFEGDVSELRVYERALPADQVQQLLTFAATATSPPPVVTQLVAPYLFRYRYDGRGRQIAKQLPGQDGEQQVVYDQLDRPLLTQDAQQRSRQEWSWVKYDVLGRPVLTGLVTRNATADQLQQQVDQLSAAATVGQFEQRITNGPYYYSTTQAYPRLDQDGFTASQVLSVTAYDDYNFDNDASGGADAAYSTVYNSQFTSAPQPDARVTGLVTRTRTRVLGVAAGAVGEWLMTTTFYDDQARPIQVRSTNARGGEDVVTNQLDFQGKLLKSYAVHTGPSHLALPVAQTLSYDAAGRVLEVRQQVDAEPTPTLVASNTYNELGQLVRKTLSPNTALQQQVDYTYNSRGWLQGLNEDLVTGATPVGTSTDLWGLRLSYDCGFQVPQYNGNISGQQWRNKADGIARAYGYSYDRTNRLIRGDYVAQAEGGSWRNEQQNYAVGMRYDENGNIQRLVRNGLLLAATHKLAPQFGRVDQLAYTYQGNRLVAVDDTITGNALTHSADYHGAATSLAGDFLEKTSYRSTGQMEYGYDANGSLTNDANKGITQIRYNFLNLPELVKFTDQDYLEFRYAANGQKVAKRVFQAGKPMVQTDYLNGYQYESDSLRFFAHAEGRVLRFVSPTSGQVRYEREYTLKDHLGNLRLAYRRGLPIAYTATLETTPADRATQEEQQWDQQSLVSTRTQVNTLARTGSYVARLNAAAGKPIGPLKLLSVQKGDTVTITAPGYYPQRVSSGSSYAFSLLGYVAQLVKAGPAPAPAGDPTKPLKPFPFLNVSLAVVPALSQVSGGVPKGYVRLLAFNQDSVLISSQTRQLSTLASSGYEELKLSLVAPTAGYMEAYVGNESEVDVYFDDVTLDYRPGLQVQEIEYDLAGLELAGLATPSPGIKGLNNYRFNSKESQSDLGLGWLDYGARFYDPARGPVWFSVDPLADKMRRWSPYVFSFDNSIRFIDADGMAPEDIIVRGTKSAVNGLGSIVNKGLGGFYKANFDANGKMTLNSTNKKGTMSAKQQNFLNVLNEGINNAKTTTVTAVQKDANVVVGNINTAQIDVSDAKKFGNGPLVSSQGAVAHELKEQFEVQVNGSTPQRAHLAATIAENRINGTARSPLTSTGSNGTDVIVDVTVPPSMTVQHATLEVKQGNVTKVDQ